MTLKAVLIANSGTHARSVRSDANENVVVVVVVVVVVAAVVVVVG